MSSERRKGCTGSTGWQRILFTMASSALCTWVGQEERKYRRRRREATLPAAQVREPPPICAARACKAARVEVGVVGPVGAWRETAHCGCRRQPPKGLGSHDPARRTNGAERSLRPPLRCGSLRTKALRAPAKPQGLRWASWGRAVRFVKLPTVAADVNRPSARAATTRQRAPLAKSGHFARRSGAGTSAHACCVLVKLQLLRWALWGRAACPVKPPTVAADDKRKALLSYDPERRLTGAE